MLFKKITKRWLINGLGVVVLLLVVLEVVIALMIRSYYYQQVQNSLYTRATSLSDMLTLAVDNFDFSFEENAKSYMESFTERDKMEFQILNARGEILSSSTGFLPVSGLLPDYQQAMQSLETEQNKPWGVWNGKNDFGQKVFALTMLIIKEDNTVAGAIRFLVALDLVDKQITLISSAMVAFGLAIVFFVVLSSMYFVNGLLKPLLEIGSAAEKIVQGDYSHRIQKTYNDEIGDLCDTINAMAEQVETSQRLQNEFISSVSHELRTPLTAIKGWSETLREGNQDTETQQKGLSIIRDESERLTGMVEELLDFSRMQSMSKTVSFSKMDVFAEVEEAVFLLQARAKKQGLTLRCVEQESLPPIRGNRDRLRQVFVNLIDNAIKYSKENGTVYVNAAPVNDTVQIIVSDDGIGIKEEDLPFITQKFYRADTTRKGSGIGLAVVKDIIASHGGTLDIESRYGKGTVVTVTLPIMKSEENYY